MRASGCVLALLAALCVTPARAQDTVPPPPNSSFLIINQGRLLTDSRSGQAILSDEEQQRDAMRTEARALDASFEAEERRLTEERPTMQPEAFRAASDAFDARVVDARRKQDERSDDLAQEFDQRRRQFYARVAPILVRLMDRFQAKAIFDETSVLLADQSLNITAAVIAEIDAEPDPQPEAPEAPTPEPPAPETPTPENSQGGQ